MQGGRRTLSFPSVRAGSGRGARDGLMGALDLAIIAAVGRLWLAVAAILWALALRATGRTPRSFIGEPDDSPEDMPQRDRVIDRSVDRAVDRDAARSSDTSDRTTR